MLSYVACLAALFLFPYLLIKGRIFGEGGGGEGREVTEYKMSIFIFSTNLSEIFLIL
jgi:hypothetical protein